ncbi:MAG: copper-containing nitrite reductase [Dehalococcoidia bacterium]|nr:nitrite reductase, copper-containing [Dehalococcoidia bacterium]MCB9484562.1 nitrite reductase, copper-containing [Thermoflexaceae bacterium]
MLFRIHPPRAAAAVLAAVAITSAFGGIACSKDSSDLKTVEAELVAPPGVPEPIRRGPAHVVVNLEAVEQQAEIAPGVQYTLWTFNGTNPGPMIRVREGDYVEVRLNNPATNQEVHNIDLHAVNGPGGGAEATHVGPGESRAFEFKAQAPGLYVYHCAAGIVADHISNGMYGAILVEPAAPLPRVDKEFYVGQSEYYTTGDRGDEGPQKLDTAKLLAETPTYVTFNGNTQSLTGEGTLQAETGDTVRIFWANGGPNLTSSFHAIGEIFDKVYEYGTFDRRNAIAHVQTVLVPPGGAAVVEFKTDVPGVYKLVDHAISRVSKGAVGLLEVKGKERPDIFREVTATPEPGTTAEPTTTATATAAATTAAATAEVLSGDIPVEMRDNSFAPKTMTVAAGSTVTFQLDNVGKAIHNMQIANSAGDYDAADAVKSDPELIRPGEKGELEWKVPAKAGTYKFRCEIHPVEMTGTLTVK